MQATALHLHITLPRDANEPLTSVLVSSRFVSDDIPASADRSPLTAVLDRISVSICDMCDSACRSPLTLQHSRRVKLQPSEEDRPEARCVYPVWDRSSQLIATIDRRLRISPVTAVLFARLLLALLEECDPDVGNNRAAYLDSQMFWRGRSDSADRSPWTFVSVRSKSFSRVIWESDARSPVSPVSRR